MHNQCFIDTNFSLILVEFKAFPFKSLDLQWGELEASHFSMAGNPNP